MGRHYAHRLKFIILCLCMPLVGCQVSGGAETNKLPSRVPASLPETPGVAVDVSSPVPTPVSATLSVPTRGPLATEEGSGATGALFITQTESASSALLFVAELPPDPYGSTAQPSHIWWSEDSRTLFFQDVIKGQAWSYDLEGKTIVEIPYELRSSGGELVPGDRGLPAEAVIFSTSPSGRTILFGMPLPEPLTPDGQPAGDGDGPRFTSELWLHRDGTAHMLGLVDACFGFFDALWTLDEHMAIVNGSGVPDMPYKCMYNAWLVNAENLTVGPLAVPRQEDDRFTVLDVSADGGHLALRRDVNTLYDVATQQETALAHVDTNRVSIVSNSEKVGLVFYEAVFSPSILHATGVVDEIQYINPVMSEGVQLGSVEGLVDQRVLSPDGAYLAFTTTNTFSGQAFEDVTPALWLMKLP